MTAPFDALTPTMIESASANTLTTVGTTVAATAFAVYAPYLAPLLPVLQGSLASGRQQKRVEDMLRYLNNKYQSQQHLIENLSDAHYKLVSEALATTFQTIDERKLNFLQRVIENTIDFPERLDGESDALARIVRDISATEAIFLLDKFKYKKIMLDKEFEDRGDTLVIKMGSEDEMPFLGLINLTLLYAQAQTWDAQAYEFSTLAVKTIKLLNGGSRL